MIKHKNQNSQITQELDNKIYEINDLLIQNYSVMEISKIIGYGYAAVYNACKRNNLEVNIKNNGKSRTGVKRAKLNRKIKLSYNELYDLYWNKQYNLYEIADLCKVNPTTVLNTLNRMNIKTRNKKEAMKLAYIKNPELRDKFRQLVYDGKTGYPQGKRESWIEKECREWLIKKGISYIQEYQIDNNGHFYDFKVGKILIEMDGDYWHSTIEQKQKDEYFEYLAQKNGYKVIRITDKELMQNKEIFDIKLEEVLNG